MGDFNANLLSTSDDAKFIRRLADDLSLKIIDHGATHFTDNSGTWIDVMLVDENDEVMSAGNRAATFRSRHNIIDVVINYHSASFQPKSFTYRNFKSIESNQLNTFLSNCDWSPLYCSDVDANSALACLSDNLMEAVDNFAPLKRFIPKSKIKPPWIDAELEHLYNKRDAVRRRLKRTGNQDLRQEYLCRAGDAEQRTHQARDSFLRNKISDAINDKKNIWKELRGLGLLPKAREDLHGFTPDELNTHFAGVSVSPSECVADMEGVVTSTSEEGFRFKKVNFADVVLAVSHFSSQARGEDGIPQSVVAKALPSIGQHLVKIFNASLSSGVFPDTWKRAQLVPLKKTSIPSSVSDFRPIALLSFLSKVLEKIVHSQISDYIVLKKLLDPLQTGFRQHNSTQTALLKLTEDIRSGIDNDRKLITFLLLFDFSKAFDSISPTRLLRRLQSMGFSRSVLLWIKSYITGRTQKIITNSNGQSDWLSTNLGVPQGSVLGPLLFSLYVNDLSQVLDPRHVRHLLYADDLQIYVQVSRENIQEGIERLSAAARGVSGWAEAAGLRLNVSKTKAIVFGSAHNLSYIEELHLPGIEMEGGTFIVMDGFKTYMESARSIYC